MATKLAGSKVKDLRVVQQNDNSSDRKKRINLMKEENRIGDEKWRLSQQQLYPNDIIPISPETTLQQIITEETERLQQDEEQQYQLGFKNLLSIADNNNAEFILDNLENNEIQYMNAKFAFLIKELKEQYTKLDKNVFINFIKQKYVADSASIDDGENISYNLNPQVNQTQRGIHNMNMRNEMRQQRDDRQQYQNQIAQDQIERENLQRRIIHDNQNEEKRQQRIAEVTARNSANKINKTAKAVLERRRQEIEEQRRLAEVFRSGQLAVDDLLRRVRAEREENALRNAIKAKDTLDVAEQSPHMVTPQKKPRKPRKQKQSQNPNAGAVETQEIGHGLKRVIHGRGATSRPSRQLINGEKFYIDVAKLQQNILSVKYAKNNATIPSLRPERITNDVKAVIKDIIDNHFNETLFQKLNETDKRVIKRFIKATKLPLDINDTDFQKRFEILKGEFESGNNSPELKAQLRPFIIEAMKENLITKNDGLLLLYHLSL